MEQNPFTFSTQNPRMVTNVETPSKVLWGTAAVFLLGLNMYNRKYFRFDGNIINLAAFTVASVPASYTYANFFLNTKENEAGLINNQRETGH